MKNKRLNKIIVSVLILLITLSITPTSEAFSQRMFIPAYFYPGPLWDQATSGAPIVEIMIMNPASGPGTSQDQNYVNSVMNSFNAGIKVLGYVDTNYSNRPLSDVKSEIDSYASWYNISGGIFLDQVSSNIADIQYYQDLVNYIRSTYNSDAFVALNPGTIPAKEYIDIGNTTVIFEGNYNTYKTWTPPDWVFNYSPYKFTHLVYDTSTSEEMINAIERAQTYNSHYVYVTDDILSNPWDALPSYWSSELDFLLAETPTNMVISKNGPVTKDHGTQMTYDLFYNNFGGNPASNVIMVDTLPTNVEYLSSDNGGIYDAVARTVTWNLGTVSTWPTGNGVVHVTVSIPTEVPIGAQISNTASISTDTTEETITDNSVTIQTSVTGSGLPDGAGIATPNSGGNTPSVFWGNPTKFTYQSCDAATSVDIRIQISDGGPDITGPMIGGPSAWSYETTFYPRHGAATITYAVHGCGDPTIGFNIYIDPAGYIYDVITNARISGAVVTLQRLYGSGGWENVPTNALPVPIMQPDANPLITGLDGQYEWLTLAGTYRVHVEAVGYYPADSRWVTVPPPVTDLHVGLRRILYSFAGFFPPVDNIPTLNTAKAGSAIPMKFSLNGNRGLNIFPSGYPKSQKISCDTSVPDEIEETVTAGQSSLSYDATADQYKYVWKTDKLWSGTCRQMIVKLNDGIDHIANFKFR